MHCIFSTPAAWITERLACFLMVNDRLSACTIVDLIKYNHKSEFSLFSIKL
jgi:hypothetical protein